MRHLDNISADFGLDDIALRFYHAVMQAGDGIEGRQNGALLPCGNVGRVFACQHDPAVDLAEIAIVLRPRLFGPIAGAAQCKGHAMPRDSYAILVFGPVLRVNAGADFDGPGHPFGRRHRREFIRVGAVEKICAQKHTPAAVVEAGVGVRDLADRKSVV